MTIFIANLRKSIDRNQFRGFFEKYGTVTNAQNGGPGFRITMSSPTEEEAAMKALNGTALNGGTFELSKSQFND